MSSEVDICNLALSHLGDESQVAAIVPPDGTIQAAHCARFYPIARDAVLQAFPWTFAIKRAALAEIENPLSDDWAYAYGLPSTCLRPLSALSPGAPAQDFGTPDTDSGTHAYLVEASDDGTAVLYTNISTAVLRYIDKVTDTTRFPPLVVLAISRLLASFLAGPILKGDTGAKVAMSQEKIFAAEFAKACEADARIGKRDTRNFRPAWISARGFTTTPTA